MVQSTNYDPEEIDFYIEECLGYYETYIAKLSHKHFDNMKQALSKELQQTPSQLEGQSDFVWNAIEDGSYYFTMRECMVLALEKINKSDF